MNLYIHFISFRLFLFLFLLFLFSCYLLLLFFFCSVNLIDINECDSNPCQNNGECKNTLGSYYCVCPRGFLGINCGSGNSTIVHVIFKTYHVLLKRASFCYIRELNQQGRRRLRKRFLKSEVALLQTLSCLFHLVQFVKILISFSF